MPKQKEHLSIWMRIEDVDDYEEFDLAAVAERLAMVGVDYIEQHSKFGVHCPGTRLTGHNYISLYWGDEEANGVKGLTKAEIAQTNEYLAHPEKYPFMPGYRPQRNPAR